MSLAHIRFIQLGNKKTEAQYTVESTDFIDSGDWVVVGALRLNKQQRQYEFTPSPIWSEKKALPPSLYGLPEAEQKNLLGGKYHGFAWGTWAMIVHEYATHFLTTGTYPDKHPPVFFPQMNCTRQP